MYIRFFFKVRSVEIFSMKRCLDYLCYVHCTVHITRKEIKSFYLFWQWSCLKKYSAMWASYNCYSLFIIHRWVQLLLLFKIVFTLSINCCGYDADSLNLREWDTSLMVWTTWHSFWEDVSNICSNVPAAHRYWTV